MKTGLHLENFALKLARQAAALVGEPFLSLRQAPWQKRWRVLGLQLAASKRDKRKNNAHHVG